MISIHTGITTLFVAGILCRLYCNAINAKTRFESGYKCINGSTEDKESINRGINGSYKDYGSFHDTDQDLESSTGNINFSLTTLKDKYNYEDI